MFWPTLNILVWGFFNQYLFNATQLQKFALSTLLGATLLIEIKNRSSVNILSFFNDEVTSRNLSNLLISPLRLYELIFSLILSSFSAVIIGISVGLATAYFLFGYNILIIGLSLAGFLFNLLFFGWSLGFLTTSLILRHGSAGQTLGWMLLFLLTPFICVYYPISTLPQSVQGFALLLPPTHVFEGLRYWVESQVFSSTHFFKALGLNIIFFIAAMIVFVRHINYARHKGHILSLAE
jgi:ABC-2 type transport system permease protein